MVSQSWLELMDSAGTGFEPVPDGEYDVIVKETEVKPTSNQKDMIVAKFSIQSGPHAGRLVWNNFVISPESPNSMRWFFEHMGILGVGRDFFAQQPSVEQVANAILGKPCRILVGQRSWQGQPRNEVKRITASFGTPPMAAPGLAAPPMAAQPPQMQQPMPVPQMQQPMAAPQPQPMQPMAPQPQPMAAPALVPAMAVAAPTPVAPGYEQQPQPMQQPQQPQPQQPQPPAGMATAAPAPQAPVAADPQQPQPMAVAQPAPAPVPQPVPQVGPDGQPLPAQPTPPW